MNVTKSISIIIFCILIISLFSCIPKAETVAEWDGSYIKLPSEESNTPSYLTYVGFTLHMSNKYYNLSNLEYFKWDFDGDGNFDSTSSVSIPLTGTVGFSIEATNVFSVAGTYNSQLVVAYNGQTAVTTIPIIVKNVNTTGTASELTFVKTPLVECITGVQCPNCGAIDKEIDDLFYSSNYGSQRKMTAIMYHISIPDPDEYENPDTKARHAKYIQDPSFAPAGMVNGLYPASNGSVQIKVDNIISSVSPSMSLDVQSTITSDNLLIVSAYASELYPVTDKKRYLNICLIENEIDNNPSYVTYSFVPKLNFVLRKIITTDYEIILPSQNHIKAHTFAINLSDVNSFVKGTVNPENLAIVAFVQEPLNSQSWSPYELLGIPAQFHLTEVVQSVVKDIY